MLNRKLFEVLKALNTSRQKRLRLFLVSPYFNNGSLAENIVQLYDLLAKYDFNESHTALSKEKVQHVFFPKVPFQENAKNPVDNLCSQLFQLVRQFLAQHEMEGDIAGIYDYLALARFYRMHALEERFWQNMNAARKFLNKSPVRDDKYYYPKFLLEQEELHFRGLYNSYQDDNNLTAAEESLDRYYSILKMEYASSLAYQKSVANLEGSTIPLLYDNLMELTAEGKLLHLPLNSIYRMIMQLLEGSSPHTLAELDNLLKKYKSEISLENLKNLKAYYRILWTKYYFKEGKSAPLPQIFEIYREHFEEGYFYYEDMIPATSFNNLVIFGLRVGEMDWVKKLLDDHPPERICGSRHPTEIHSLCMAEYYFVQKDYDTAHDCLQYCHFENPGFNLISDQILLRIYFETENELLEPRMRALEQKVRRTKLNRVVKTRYYNFLKKLDKIIKYGWQKNSPKRAKLIEEIKSVPEIVSREWLLEKVSEK